jgi:hypothetical protein
MNKFEILYIYTWKCHKETPCRAILNRQKCSLTTTKKKKKKNHQPKIEQEGKIGLVWGLIPVGGGKT